MIRSSFSYILKKENLHSNNNNGLEKDFKYK